MSPNTGMDYFLSPYLWGDVDINMHTSSPQKILAHWLKLWPWLLITEARFVFSKMRRIES